MKYAIIFILTILQSLPLHSQIPLVYSVENSAENCTQPPLPELTELPVVRPLTDPFKFSDGTTRLVDFSDWECRRNEIMAEIQHYEIGEIPGKPDELTASFQDSILTVNVKVGEQVLQLNSTIILPKGNGPFPVIIGIGWGTGSLPPGLFTERNVAQVAFNFSEVMSHTQTRGNEPINKLYPDLTYIGAYSAWSWGVSRIIDGLELVAEQMNLDMSHMGITGCSFAGKMALFAGAFDERIALTIAQESGGGGAAAWRVSETLGNVETLARTSHAWFIEDMFQFSNAVNRLPYDHHELMALVAPRALLVLGNPDMVWLAEESGYVSAQAAHKVWKQFGIGDRFGYSFVAGHPHCRLPESQFPEVEAFIDKFLLGKDATTDVTVHPFDYVDHERWTEWWGSDEPVFPERDAGDAETFVYEAECAQIGTDWEIKDDELASKQHYVQVQNQFESPDAAPEGPDGLVEISFTAEKDSVYHVFARLNCATANDDSFWIQLDEDPFQMVNGLQTSGWEWLRLTRYLVKKGKHVLKIGYRENGAKLDKISVSSYAYAPSELGAAALNCD